MATEHERSQKEVAEVEHWWKVCSRSTLLIHSFPLLMENILCLSVKFRHHGFAHVKRPYTTHQVVTKRDHQNQLPIGYSSQEALEDS